MAAALFPEAQRKVQEQLDAILGPDRSRYLSPSGVNLAFLTTSDCHPLATWILLQRFVLCYYQLTCSCSVKFTTQVTAFYLETFRWRPISVDGVPHRASKDIVYGPYVIPKGATVIAHHWLVSTRYFFIVPGLPSAFLCRSLGRDPELYPDAEKFRPSRWITETGEINEEIKFYNFGFGRR